MEELGSHWADLLKLDVYESFRKCVEKIQITLKSDKENENFT
jgi:hypothetical protein